MRWTFTVPTGIAAWQRPGSNAGQRFTPRAVKASEDAIAFRARSAGVPALGVARVGLRVAIPRKTRGDVDNRLKTVMDALQRGGIIANDDQVDAARVVRTLEPRASPRITLYVIEPVS